MRVLDASIASTGWYRHIKMSPGFCETKRKHRRSLFPSYLRLFHLWKDSRAEAGKDTRHVSLLALHGPRAQELNKTIKSPLHQGSEIISECKHTGMLRGNSLRMNCTQWRHFLFAHAICMIHWSKYINLFKPQMLIQASCGSVQGARMWRMQQTTTICHTLLKL